MITYYLWFVWDSMSRCTNPIGVRLFVDVPNKVVIKFEALDVLLLHDVIRSEPRGPTKKKKI